jgi:hypothetical protein
MSTCGASVVGTAENNIEVEVPSSAENNIEAEVHMIDMAGVPDGAEIPH